MQVRDRGRSQIGCNAPKRGQGGHRRLHSLPLLRQPVLAQHGVHVRRRCRLAGGLCLVPDRVQHAVHLFGQLHPAAAAQRGHVRQRRLQLPDAARGAARDPAA